MDHWTLRQILKIRKIAYAITDKNLVVLETGGLSEILHEAAYHCQECSLLDMVPELIGYEEMLDDILTGRLEGFRIDMVNREVSSGIIRYLTIDELPITDDDGQVTGILHLAEDVSNWGEVEQKISQNRNEIALLKDEVSRQNVDLLAANTELHRLDELKSQFISVAAHELRTPLTSINGFVEMLLDEQVGSLTKEQRKYLGVMQQSGFRLMGLVEQLLTATRLESGRIDLELHPKDLSVLVHKVATELALQIKRKKHSVFLDLPDGLPPVLCDENRTKQILINLFDNAIKYTPEEGKITIRLQKAKDQGYLQLSVQDTGIGISHDDQKRLFGRWFRAKNVKPANSSGAGLGLFITRSLAELQGGSVWVESHPNQGSTFHVTFPIAS